MTDNTNNDYQELLRWFKTQRLQMWDELSENDNLPDNVRNLCATLYKMRKYNNSPSASQLRWAKSIIENLNNTNNQSSGEKNIAAPTITEIRHLTARIAWHDNGWNGEICKNPELNEYCNGENSLLSRRLRERKPDNCDINKGKSFVEIRKAGELPPCYWCINISGSNELQVEHDNPAAPKIGHIPEILPPYSIFSWPFKLSFVRENNAAKDYGRYFPEQLLEARIKNFQSKFEINKSIVFLYANYDNPVSGEEQKYLLVGCAFLKDMGGVQYFEIPDEELSLLRKRRDSQNFPRLSWNLRYSLDLPDNGYILPYHEYIELGLDNNELLDDMKVVIDEPELVDGFKYVAMDVDDDQAIYLLMKLRKSLLKIKDHNLVNKFDISKALEINNIMLGSTWRKRGHFPGFNKLAGLFFGKRRNFDVILPEILNNEDENYFNVFIHMLEKPDTIPSKYNKYKDIFDELHDEIIHRNLTINDFLSLSMLDITSQQFLNLLNNSNGLSLKDIATNPYLLYEEYEQTGDDEDETLGNKIDGVIDLYKIDIAYFPDREFSKKITQLQNIKIDDPRRIRAIIIDYLLSLEGKGDCFDEAEAILNVIKEHPLFYRKFDDADYHINENFRSLSEVFQRHLEEKLVIKKDKTTHHCYYYLKDIYEAELYIKEIVTKLLNEQDNDDKYNDFTDTIQQSAKDLKKKLGNRFDSEEFITERNQLYQNVFNKRFFVLSGSPGAGKSHELLQIIKAIREKKETCLVLAPTGKAALRLNVDETFGKFAQAKTIDKHLHDDDETLLWSNIIIDEMSMVDLIKFYELVQSLKIESRKIKRIILVGDQYQLPPIGYGKVFSDIIEHIENNPEYKENHVTLTVNCRQEIDDTIIDFAKIFSNQNKNYEELLYKLTHVKPEGQISKGLFAFYWNTREELQELLFNHLKVIFESKTRNVNNLLNTSFGLDKEGYVDEDSFPDSLMVDSFQIITPYRTAFYGSMGINNSFQGHLKKEEDFISNESLLKHSDKVILIKNNYHGGKLILSNGSMGIVNEKGWFYFPELGEPTKDVDHTKCELAYAVTVHKSQGSGFQHVFVIIPDKMTLLSRELLYTALTRSRQSISLFIYGENNKPAGDSIFNIIRNRTYVDYRKTSLFNEPAYGYSYLPDVGIKVKSRVEYIIYKKLKELMDTRGDFTFTYEEEYKLEGKKFLIHPDFTIRLLSGRIVYWEHLGRLRDKQYRTNWEKRYRFYIEKGDDKNLITTDELNGIDDKKIETIIDDIVNQKIKGDSDIKYSRNHYSLTNKINE